MAKASTAGKSKSKAKSASRSRSSASKTASKSARRSAPPGESEKSQRTRSDAQTRAGRSRTGSEQGTEDVNDKRSVAEHSEHPENPGDSTVRHANPTVRAGSEGQKGFPQGEYDVTPPKKEPAKAQRSVTQANLEQHMGDQDVEAIEKQLKAPKANRLKPQERALALEGLPIGAILEHEGQFRWRVKGPTGGGNRFGHGSTAQEAIESYVLGSSSATVEEAGARAFSELEPRQQKEIEARDAAVAKRQGISVESLPEVIARREFQENEKARGKAKAPAANATTDGPEVASAQLEAGARRGQAKDAGEDEGEGKKEKAARKRSSARRRTGAKSRR